MAGPASDGISIAAPVAKAAADAACPEGKDEVRGARRSRRRTGTPTSGRRRPAMPLPMTSAAALAAAMLPRPRQAARRACLLPVAHSAAASTIQR
jgi:hypothetical protein